MATAKFVQTPQISLYTGMAPTDTTARIIPYPVDLDGVKLTFTDFGSSPTFTVDPKISGYEEINGFTGLVDNGDGTGTLTGLTRNLLAKSPYTASPSGGKSHGSSAVVVFSDNPQVFASIYAYIDAAVIAGGVPASTTALGFIKLSTPAVSGPSPIAVGDNDTRVPTQGENDGLAATTTPASTNLFITQKDLQKGTVLFAADAGSTDAYAISLSIAPAAYVAGMVYRFKANTLNTGAATLNVNSLGAITIKKAFNADLATGDILAGQYVEVIYDGTNFQILSPTSSTLTSVAGGITTHDLSTTTSNVIAHGLGISPKSIRMRGIYNSNTTQTTSITSCIADVIFVNGVQSGISYLVSETDTGSTKNSQISTGFTIWTAYNGGGGTDNHESGTITVDATNITIAWSKTGTPTGTLNIIWDAIA